MSKIKATKILNTEMIPDIPPELNIIAELGRVNIGGEQFLIALPTISLLRKYLKAVTKSTFQNDYMRSLLNANIEYLWYQYYIPLDTQDSLFFPTEENLFSPIEEKKPFGYRFLCVTQFGDTFSILHGKHHSHSEKEVYEKSGTIIMLVPLDEDGKLLDRTMQKTTNTGTIVHGGTLFLGNNPVTFESYQMYSFDTIKNMKTNIRLSDTYSKEGYELPWMVVDGCLLSLVPMRGFLEITSHHL